MTLHRFKREAEHKLRVFKHAEGSVRLERRAVISALGAPASSEHWSVWLLGWQWHLQTRYIPTAREGSYEAGRQWLRPC